MHGAAWVCAQAGLKHSAETQRYGVEEILDLVLLHVVGVQEIPWSKPKELHLHTETQREREIDR